MTHLLKFHVGASVTRLCGIVLVAGAGVQLPDAVGAGAPYHALCERAAVDHSAGSRARRAPAADQRAVALTQRRH